MRAMTHGRRDGWSPDHDHDQVVTTKEEQPVESSLYDDDDDDNFLPLPAQKASQMPFSPGCDVLAVFLEDPVVDDRAIESSKAARQAVFCRVSCTGRWTKWASIGRPSRGRRSIAVVAMIASRTIIIRHPPQAWGTPTTTTINWYTKRTSYSIPPGLSCVVRPTLPLAPRKPLSFSGSEHLFGTQAGVAAVHYHSIQTTSTPFVLTVLCTGRY